MKNKGLTVAARDNGNLTARDKAKLTREQNRVSGNSYRKNKTTERQTSVDNPPPKMEKKI